MMHRCFERGVALALMMKMTGFGGDGCLGVVLARLLRLTRYDYL